MARPRLDDDGQALTLDLHGATVDEAMRLAEAVTLQAARYGRATVRLIHGSSTTGAGVRTIKRALYDALDHGEFDRHVTTSFRDEDVLRLAIAPSPSPINGRVRLADLY